MCVTFLPLPLPPLLCQVPDVEQFMATYNMQCPMAAKRLIHSGMPATIEHNVRPRPDQTTSSAVAVAETVQHFITVGCPLLPPACSVRHPCSHDLARQLPALLCGSGICCAAACLPNRGLRALPASPAE